MEREGLRSLDSDAFARFSEAVQPLSEFMMYYDSALSIVRSKVEALDKEFEVKHQRNPVENIKSRLKKPSSIIEKLQREGYEITLENARKYVTDIAGIRIICTFTKDIIHIANLLMNQDDVKTILLKDYINHPKPNGYRSLHLIVEVPVFLSTGRKNVTVEIQIRTVAMDFWACIEHKINYKKNIPNKEVISERLHEIALQITNIDLEMQSIDEKITAQEAVDEEVSKSGV